jgi:hypothetical protein
MWKSWQSERRHEINHKSRDLLRVGSNDFDLKKIGGFFFYFFYALLIFCFG